MKICLVIFNPECIEPAISFIASLGEGWAVSMVSTAGDNKMVHGYTFDRIFFATGWALLSDLDELLNIAVWLRDELGLPSPTYLRDRVPL